MEAPKYQAREAESWMVSIVIWFGEEYYGGEKEIGFNWSLASVYLAKDRLIGQSNEL